MELTVVPLQIPKDCNVILGQSHFIKTVEDLYEVLVGTVAQASFGIAFCEASGPCLVRAEGNDEELTSAAISNAQTLGAGHAFIILLRNAYPINVMERIKHCPEVCRIICATSNPVQVVLAETEQGRGILGVVDGFHSKGVETPEDVQHRQEFLRKIGYKR